MRLSPDTQLARVRVVLETTDLPGDLYRDDPYGAWPVRGASGLTSPLIVDDYEAPFGVPLTYRIAATAEDTVLPVTVPWLGHPTRPALSMRLDSATDDPHSYTAPGTVHRVFGSEWPVVTYSARNQHEGTLTVWAQWHDRHRLANLLAPGSPLLLRTPATDAVDDMWLWPGQVEREVVGRHDTPAYLRWKMKYQRVSVPAGHVTHDPSNSWDALVVDHPTWDELAAAHPTWDDLALTPHPHTP